MLSADSGHLFSQLIVWDTGEAQLMRAGALSGEDTDDHRHSNAGQVGFRRLVRRCARTIEGRYHRGIAATKGVTRLDTPAWVIPAPLLALLLAWKD